MEREDGENDGGGRGEKPRRVGQSPGLGCVLQHNSPAWRRFRKPETDERQRRLGENEGGQQQRQLDSEMRPGRGKKVT